MAVIMENDMIEGSTPLQPEDLQKLSKMTKYQINRRKAELWAHKDIKFLVYDNTHLMENGYDSDDEEGMMDFSMKRSRGSSTQGADSNKEDANQPQIAESSAGPATAGQEDEKEPEGCKFCSFIPEFPRKWRPRKLRLVKPYFSPTDKDKWTAAEDICSHYVAISYCWPVPQQDEHGNTIITPTTYQVRDLDGTIRPSRALDDVLDRAVDFAISLGIRMIWIDQECLPQPTEESSQEDKDYQQLGLQAMDIVYNRAVVTAGLLASKITNQEEINAVNVLMEFELCDSGTGIRWAGPGSGPGPARVQYLKHTVDFLERMVDDRWYTRCWVAQEALSAGNRLMVVFTCGPGVSDPCQYEISRPGGQSMRPTLQSERKIQSEVIAIPVKRLRNLIEITEFLAKYFLHGHVFAQDTSVLEENLTNVEIMNLIDRAVYVTTVARKLQPAAPGPTGFFIVAGTSYGPRQTVDAAGALTLLKTRNCRDVADRVVIVANMCNFANRLDIRALAQNCKSLRLAVLALSVLNGDYSLLVPEAYRLENSKDECYNLLSQPTMRWLWPLSATPHLIDSCSVRPGDHMSQSSHNPNQPFSTDGLHLGAYLWIIEKPVDFTQIQRDWAEEWNRIRSLRVLMKLGETSEEDLERQRMLVKDIFSGQDKSHEYLQDVLSPGNQPTEDDIENDNLRRQEEADALLIQCFPEVQQVFTNIIIAVLRFLFNNEETDPRAMALANSIWHSVRVATIDGEDEEHLPDDVGDWIFCHPALVDKPHTLLQLDKTQDGSLGQLWFVERIMRDGSLWVGHVDSTNEWLELKDHPAGGPTDSVGSNLTASKGKISDQSGNGDSNSPSNAQGLETRSLIQRQMSRKLLAMLFSASVEEETSSGWTIDPRNMATFAHDVFNYMHAVNRGQRDFVAAFDVDGPCIVAIPYNGEWEMLPRPALRSMSVCWVIESVSGGAEKGLCKDADCETLDNGDRVDAPDTVKAESDHVLQDVSTGPVRDCSPGKQLGQSKTSSSSSEDTRSEDEPLSSYRVLSKTRGLWPIIPEQPTQKYRFV